MRGVAVSSHLGEMEKEFQRFFGITPLECVDIETLVDYYVDSELPAELLPKFQAHLMRCHSCRELVDDVLAIVDVARTLGNQALPSGVKDRLREHLKEQVNLKLPPKLYLVK